MDNCLLRWSLGLQDTVSLSDADNDKHKDSIWLAKLSILSFQRHFPNAEFVLLYNGPDFNSFLSLFNNSAPNLEKELRIIDQRRLLGGKGFKNPYHFYPRGVWWKWIPFRLDRTKHEIAIDTDIVCLSTPKTWQRWISGTEHLLVAPERYETVLVNTCGDFHAHPVLYKKAPFNCGIVGQRAGFDFAERFFEITKQVNLGSTHNSMFITEQGAINVWVRSLEQEGIGHFCLDFMSNAWIRDFLYFAKKGIQIETVHAVTWHKNIVKQLKNIFERMVQDDTYNQEMFVSDIIEQSSSMDKMSRHVIYKQITPGISMDNEILMQ